jgi:hypothetical protein
MSAFVACESTNLQGDLTALCEAAGCKVSASDVADAAEKVIANAPKLLASERSSDVFNLAICLVGAMEDGYRSSGLLRGLAKALIANNAESQIDLRLKLLSLVFSVSSPDDFSLRSWLFTTVLSLSVANNRAKAIVSQFGRVDKWAEEWKLSVCC